ncbi:hypothetical protein [Sporosarcina sp. ANT_H38]|uniref:hypothetical protein n=1 Tax=Sporosarcina sp. ANT_H38 TaxID=2597358 RepID=UPI00165DB7FB|nr:hypothetical protein [Sporosarcina sp. ANT_H38]
MNRKAWLFIFWILLVVYFGYSVFVDTKPLWVRILGLVVVIMWGLLTPIIGKRKKKQEG